MKQTVTDQGLTGIVLEIQRMSTEDGPGLRTTVFFKGCGLGCSWCHNPESLERAPELQWIDSRCILCAQCIDACPRGALKLAGTEIVIDRSVCAGCGTCAAVCPSTALELIGAAWSVESLADEVMKDRSYYGTGGGVTASGGEAALQAPFVAALFRELKSRGIGTALDTSGHCRRDHLDMILPFADLVLYDIKEIDSERHRAFTGSGNKRILDNFIYTAGYVRGHILPGGIWVRTPIIPGATDRRENIAGIGALIAAHGSDVVTRWELCSFNNLCRDKYRRLGKEWDFTATPLVGRETMEELADAARSSGVDPSIVRWSGATDSAADEAPAADAMPAIKKHSPSC